MGDRITFNDIMKSITNGAFSLNNPAGVEHILFMMGLAFALALFIFYIYKLTFSGVLYSRSFNVSLMLLTLVTALVIRTITSNLALSLGMVGALSIVRFRTAVKDAMDTVYMFWAVAVGITVGAGTSFYIIAIVGTFFIGLLMFVMSLSNGKGRHPYLLILRYDFSCTNEINVALNRLPKKSRLKSKTVTRNGVELTMEVRLPGENTNLVNDFLRINGVFDATLVSYQGDYQA